jgi:hypothetical protein
MEHDITSLVIEAQDARSRMQEAKKRIKAEVRRKYEAAMKRDTAEAIQDAEIEFARTLARVNASGVSQSILRREVLRTNVWDIWTYWRDLAGMDPERVTIQNAKKERERENAVFLWSEDYQTLTVKKNSKGVALDPAVVYYMGNLRKMGSYWMADTEDDDYELAVRKADESYAFLKMVTAEIQRVIDAGHLDNPEHKG